MVNKYKLKKVFLFGFIIALSGCDYLSVEPAWEKDNISYGKNGVVKIKPNFTDVTYGTINWGDGKSDKITGKENELTHTYEYDGTWPVEVNMSNKFNKNNKQRTYALVKNTSGTVLFVNRNFSSYASIKVVFDEITYDINYASTADLNKIDCGFDPSNAGFKKDVKPAKEKLLGIILKYANGSTVVKKEYLDVKNGECIKYFLY